MFLERPVPIQTRTSHIKFDHSAENSKRNTVPNFPTWLQAQVETLERRLHQSIQDAKEHAKKEEDARNAVDVNSSVAKEDDVTHCALSGEPFEVFYNEDEDEWHFKRATRLPRDYKGVPAGSIVLVTALPKDGNYDDEDDEEEDEEEEEEEEEVVEEPAPEIKEEPEPEPATKKRKAAVKVKEEVKEEKVEAAVEPVATRRSKRRKSE